MDEPFTLLPISLGPMPNTSKTAPTDSKNTRVRNATVEELLSHIADPELLEKENKYECTNCKEKVMAGKSHTISSAAKLLLLHIKRFSKANGTATKRSDHVRFNRVLQLEKTSLTKETVLNYKLKGVIVHNGNDAASGHYIAYVLHGDEWLRCSDSNVTKVQWSTVKARQAYALFYERAHLTNTLLPPQKKKKRLNQLFPSINQSKYTSPGKQKGKDLAPGSSKETLRRKTIKVPHDKPKDAAKEQSGSENKFKVGREKHTEGKNETSMDPSYRAILKELQSRVNTLEDKVESLYNENLRLKLEVIELRRKGLLNDEDEAAYRTMDDTLMRAAEENSPTPVEARTVEEIQHRRYNPSGKKHLECSSDHGREERETHLLSQRSKWRKQRSDRRGSDPSEMEMDEDDTISRRAPKTLADRWEDDRTAYDEDRRKRKNRNATKSSYTEQIKPEKAHREYLEGCYRRQIGLPLDKKQSINIYSYTDHKVARGYQKVVTTCQGMYYELTEEQVLWRELPKERLTVGGDLCWRGEGVSVYKPTSRRETRPIVPHRFAINSTNTAQRTKLRTDRYYMHVYQTKIGPDRRALKSREMVQEMPRRFKELYWPRLVDTQSRRLVRRTSERAGHRHKSELLKTRTYARNSSPERRPRRRAQMDPIHIQSAEILTGLQRLTAAVERLVDGRRR